MKDRSSVVALRSGRLSCSPSLRPGARAEGGRVRKRGRGKEHGELRSDRRGAREQAAARATDELTDELCKS